MAIQNPEKYVLKPQREGGGNNVYGKEVSSRFKMPCLGVFFNGNCVYNNRLVKFYKTLKVAPNELATF